MSRTLPGAGTFTVASDRIGALRFAQSNIQFECELHIIIWVGQSRMIASEIVLVIACGGIMYGGKIDDPRNYGSLRRIAGHNYRNVRGLIAV